MAFYQCFLDRNVTVDNIKPTLAKKLIKLFGADFFSSFDSSDVSNIRRSIQRSFSLVTQIVNNSFSWGKIKNGWSWWNNIEAVT